MKRMAAAKIHRIFLCDEAAHLIRVISLGDILGRLSKWGLASVDNLHTLMAQ